MATATLPETFDYIVVGAGSAGAIVATRLSEDPNTRVLLLEAGPEDQSYWSRIPLGFAKIIFKEKYMWRQHTTAPEPHLNGRSFPLPHGKLIGGSSAINGLVHSRGVPLDYDTWEAQGAEGWGYEKVLPYFKKLESHHLGEGRYHGGSGPIVVERARWKNPLGDAFIEAAQKALDIPRNLDFGGKTVDGTGYWDLATSNGTRSSTSRMYLQPHRARPNLKIVSEAYVTKVLFNGKRARGVRYEWAGRTLEARAGREVILSAGALQTPQLLQLSGVGPGPLLQEHGIEVVHDLPGVGENLSDHMQAGRVYSTSSPYTFNAQVNGPLGYLKAGLQYYLGNRKGPLTIGAALAGAYLRTRPDVQAADVQLHLLPFMPGDKGYDLAEQSGFRLAMYQCRPLSRGHVRIVSNDPRDNPHILFNHLAEEEDRRAILEGMRMAKKIAEAMPRELNIQELKPGPEGDTDEGLLDYIRANADTSFHFCGTARMGTDEMAVVDPQLRVRGVQGLRVIDASVMPTEASANINPAVLMIGEKGADLLKEAPAS